MTALLQPLAERLGKSQAFWLWVGIATLIALALRLYKIHLPGFWIDELLTVYTVADIRLTHTSKMFGYLPTWLGFWISGVDPTLLPQVNLDSSQWRSLGVTHTSARMGSMLVGVISIPLIAAASRRMIGWGPACILALLLAIAPWHIYWSQGARFYTLQFLFYTLAAILYFTSTEDGSRRRYVLAMVCLVLAFLSQPTALAILPLFAADWIISIARGKPVRLQAFGWAVGGLAVGLCFAILAKDVFAKPDEWKPFVAFGGVGSQPSPMALAMGTAYMTGPTIMIAAAATAIWIRESHPRLAIYLGLIALLPVLLFSVWSLRNSVGLRYLMICLYGWLALAAIGTDKITTMLSRRDRLLAWAPLVLLISSWSMMLLGYYTTGYGFHPRWPEAYAFVSAHSQPGDVVTARHPIIGRYYLEDPSVDYIPKSYEELTALGDRVWLVVERESTSDRDIGSWAYEVAEVVYTLELNVPRPISRITVLLYERDRTDIGRSR